MNNFPAIALESELNGQDRWQGSGTYLAWRSTTSGQALAIFGSPALFVLSLMRKRREKGVIDRAFFLAVISKLQ